MALRGVGWLPFSSGPDSSIQRTLLSRTHMKPNSWNPFLLAVLLCAGCERRQSRLDTPTASNTAPELQRSPLTDGASAAVTRREFNTRAPAQSKEARAEALIARGLNLLNNETSPNPSQRATAFGYFREAAELGSGPAYTLLGFAYNFGVGTGANSTMAVAALRSAAARNEPEATVLLAYMYRTGTIANHDLKLAEEYARTGAAWGVPECIEILKEIGRLPEPMSPGPHPINRLAEFELPNSLRMNLDSLRSQHREWDDSRIASMRRPERTSPVQSWTSGSQSERSPYPRVGEESSGSPDVESELRRLRAQQTWIPR